MGDFNKVLLMGRLTADPELRYTQTGTAVCDLRMAVNEKYVTRDGEKKEEVCFLSVTVWARRAETCAEYLKKGRSIFVEGSLKMDKWETPDGQKRSKLRIRAWNVQFLGGPRQEGGTSIEPVEKGPPPEQENPLPAEDKEDLPF